MSTQLSISALAFAKSLRASFPSFWTHTPKLAVAVSGGPDSIALLYLLRRQLAQIHNTNLSNDTTGATDRLVAITIDHGFRTESRQEAQNVADYSRSIGVQHATLPIPWSQFPFPAKPLGNAKTELAARNARLSLFRSFMIKHGIETICMGHHKGDQVENLLLWGKVMNPLSRLPRSTFDQTAFDGAASGLRILRPLLEFDKSELVATCHAHDLPYFIDPTNLDKSYTPRNALREELQEFQSRHEVHPHRLSVTPPTSGGPLVSLQHVVSKESKITATAIEPSPNLSRRDFLNYHITPSSFDPSTPPASIRTHLKSLIDAVGPRTARRISEVNLERTRQILFGELPLSSFDGPPGSIEAQRFTPGGGVVIWRKRGDWVISRQAFRAVDIAGRIELRLGGKWVEWDGRIWVRLFALRMETEDCRWYFEARGKSAFPVLIRAKLGEKSKTVLRMLGDGAQMQGEWSDDSIRIEWKISSGSS